MTRSAIRTGSGRRSPTRPAVRQPWESRAVDDHPFLSWALTQLSLVAVVLGVWWAVGDAPALVLLGLVLCVVGVVAGIAALFITEQRLDRRRR